MCVCIVVVCDSVCVCVGVGGSTGPLIQGDLKNQLTQFTHHFACVKDRVEGGRVTSNLEDL